MAQRSDRGGNKYGTDELFVDVVVLAAIFDECVRELFLGKEKARFVRVRAAKFFSAVRYNIKQSIILRHGLFSINTTTLPI